MFCFFWIVKVIRGVRDDKELEFLKAAGLVGRINTWTAQSQACRHTTNQLKVFVIYFKKLKLVRPVEVLV